MSILSKDERYAGSKPDSTYDFLPIDLSLNLTIFSSPLYLEFLREYHEI